MKFWYKDLIDLGFKKREYDDSVFEQQHGFSAWDLEYKLFKDSELVWSPIDREVKMSDIQGNIIRKLTSLEDIKYVIELHDVKKAIETIEKSQMDESIALYRAVLCLKKHALKTLEDE